MAQGQPLDEIVWEAPYYFKTGDPWWTELHANNVHFYFHESPFFDRMSNNSAIETQAKVDPSKNHLLADRKLFEKAVQEMPSGGMEFMIVSEPQRMEDGSSNGTYIMQKQHRRKVQGEPDELTLLGQWLIVDIQIIQAPSVFDVLSCRFLSTTLALNKFMTTVSSLPLFSPSAGHSYLPLTSSKPGSHSASQSRAGTPPPELSTQASQSKKNSGAPVSKRAVEMSLFESLSASIRYDGEYVDENPLKGEPGSFVFQSTNTHIRQQQDAQAKAAEAKAAATLKAMQESTTATATPRFQAETQPPQVAKLTEKLRTNSITGGKEKKNKKKSKPPSPTGNTPTPSR